MQTCLCYNPDDISELLSNGKRRTYFWRSQLPGSQLISYYSPPLRASDFHQEVGDFIASVFVPGTTQVCTRQSSVVSIVLSGACVHFHVEFAWYF